MKVGLYAASKRRITAGNSGFSHDSREARAFEGIEEDIEIIGFINCGGCPAKKAVLRARELVKRGADTIAFASCIQKGTPIGYPCPFARKMKELIANDWERVCSSWTIHIKAGR